MADQLNMGGLSINDGSGGPGGPGPHQGQRSYIPPHMRGKMGGANGGPPPMNGPPANGPPANMNGLNNSAWAG